MYDLEESDFQYVHILYAIWMALRQFEYLIGIELPSSCVKLDAEILHGDCEYVSIRCPAIQDYHRMDAMETRYKMNEYLECYCNAHDVFKNCIREDDYLPQIYIVDVKLIDNFMVVQLIYINSISAYRIARKVQSLDLLAQI